jgi:hypothetical protein
MPIAQVLLSNTFNEFRQTVNEIGNTVVSFTDGTGNITANVLSANSANLTGNLTTDVLSANSANLTGNLTTDVLSANSANVTGNITAAFFIGDGSQLTNAGATITDDTTSSSDQYILFDDITSGSATSVGVSSTKLKFVPQTGTLTVIVVDTTQISGNIVFTSTGQVELPVGTTADRSSSNVGSIRYNSELNSFEGYGSAGWGAIGGGGGAAVGGGTDEIFFESEQTANNTYTITAGKNALTTGPFTIADGVTVTVPAGSRFVII